MELGSTCRASGGEGSMAPLVVCGMAFERTPLPALVLAETEMSYVLELERPSTTRKTSEGSASVVAAPLPDSCLPYSLIRGQVMLMPSLLQSAGSVS